MSAARRGRGRAAAIVAIGLMVSLVACSDSGDSSGSSAGSVANTTGSAATDDTGSPGTGSIDTGSPGTDASVVPLPPPIVEQIAAAVGAVEEELGGPQQYFEINATAQLINLFVALNDGAVVQPWLYVDGTLTDSEGMAVDSGGTFTADLLDFDPATIFTKLEAEVPGATIESFYIHGDGQGHVLYGAFVTSARGGALEIILGPDGAVKSVDPVN
ncbi:MAG: hypothetical protein ABMA25_01835 [Ilumatobacteraceae bacterium]